MNKFKIFTLNVTLAISLLLSGCSYIGSFFSTAKDNTKEPTPLTEYPAEVVVHNNWRTGTGAGSDGKFLKQTPTINRDVIFTADAKGRVSAVSLNKGKTLWTKKLKTELTSGLGHDDDNIYVASEQGDVFALSQKNGDQVWTVNLHGEILTDPTIANGILLVKTIDDNLYALSTKDGKQLWHYQDPAPTLILRGGSRPAIIDDMVLAGFANGKLALLRLQTGELLWSRPIATPQGQTAVEQMVDINIDPVVRDGTVYVATYQGRIMAVNINSGRTIWQHDISSYSGLTVGDSYVFVTDAQSHLWAFELDNGDVVWKQTKLAYRNLTEPAVTANTVAVADGEGYIHWLSSHDGHLLGRTQLDKHPIWVTPIVVDNQLIVLNQKGKLASFSTTPTRNNHTE